MTDDEFYEYLAEDTKAHVGTTKGRTTTMRYMDALAGLLAHKFQVIRRTVWGEYARVVLGVVDGVEHIIFDNAAAGRSDNDKYTLAHLYTPLKADVTADDWVVGLSKPVPGAIDRSHQKFCVMRRDGTVPECPVFVLCATDPAAYAAMQAYAAKCKELGMLADYCHDAAHHAQEFATYTAEPTHAPDAPSTTKRQPNSAVLVMLEHGCPWPKHSVTGEGNVICTFNVPDRPDYRAPEPDEGDA